jgi:hypothetical protein
LDVSSTCPIGAGAKISGAPAIIADVSVERVLVTDSTSSSLLAWKKAGSTCDSLLVTPKQTVGSGSVASPTTDGTNVYVSYQNTGIAKVPFSGGSFQTPFLRDLNLAGQVGLASLTQARLFVGVNQATFTYRAYGTDMAPTMLWPGVDAGRMLDTILAPPVVNNGVVIGAADLNDGLLRAFMMTDGSVAFSYNPTAAAPKSALSPVAISGGTPSVYYFSDGSGELNAVVQKGMGGAIAPNWGSSFKGKSALGTDLSFTSYGTEPVIGPDGTLYFAANNATNTNANVYAIMTDTGPGVAPGPTNWPRVGFDNCNSNNSSLTNCQ